MRKFEINLFSLLRGYKSGWIGISSDFKSVLVRGRTLRETRKKAKKLGKRVYFFPAGESYGNFIGNLDEQDS